MIQPDGTSVKAQIATSDDGITWKTVSAGEFSNIKNNPIEQVVSFKKPVKARYIKFIAEHAAEGNDCIAICELGVLSK